MIQRLIFGGIVGALSIAALSAAYEHDHKSAALFAFFAGIFYVFFEDENSQ